MEEKNVCHYKYLNGYHILQLQFPSPKYEGRLKSSDQEAGASEP